MKKFIKFIVLTSLFLGGWALAAASLHVVRSAVPADKPGWLPVYIELVPKSNLTFTNTWVDTTRWSASDLASNAKVVDRLHNAGKPYLVPLITEPLARAAETSSLVPPAAASTDAPASSPTSTPAATGSSSDKSTPATPAAPPAKKEKSIFDFSK